MLSSHMLLLKSLDLTSRFVRNVGVFQQNYHLPDLSPGDKDEPVKRVLWDSENCDHGGCECCEVSEEVCECREWHSLGCGYGCHLECMQALKRTETLVTLGSLRGYDLQRKSSGI